MPVNLSIKNVPDDVADRLRARAAANHRSLQNEMLVVLKAVASGSFDKTADNGLRHILDKLNAMNFRTDATAAPLVRSMRDER